MAAPPPGDVHVIVKDPNPGQTRSQGQGDDPSRPSTRPTLTTCRAPGRSPSSLIAERHAFDKKKGVGGKLIQQWKDQVKQLERPASSTLEAFLFDSDDPRVHKGRQMLALPGEDSTRAGTTGRAASRATSGAPRGGPGRRRPFTNWDAVHDADYAWNDWGKAQTTALDLMDIDYLRLAQADTDSTTRRWCGTCRRTSTAPPAAARRATPVPHASRCCSTNRGGPLVGIEAVAGIPWTTCS